MLCTDAIQSIGKGEPEVFMLETVSECRKSRKEEGGVCREGRGGVGGKRGEGAIYRSREDKGEEEGKGDGSVC